MWHYDLYCLKFFKETIETAKLSQPGFNTNDISKSFFTLAIEDGPWGGWWITKISVLSRMKTTETCGS